MTSRHVQRETPAARGHRLSAAVVQAAGNAGDLPERAWFASLRRRLGAWFARHGRDLPWRRSRDPYTVWLSEVMLQQTTVAMARPHFDRFVARFPDVAALAAAEEHEVLRLWEGLGYYRRARQLHAAARLIADEHGGQFPRDFVAVGRLPGVGRYTAGAILSFAFDQPRPILEANTIRLWARLLGEDNHLQSSVAQRRLWAAAEAVLPRGPGSRRLNLALMDLGATVCTPREPVCDACPAAAWCEARRHNRQHEIPRVKAVAAPTAVREAALVVRRRGRVLMVRYGDGGRWSGMWDFPRFPVTASAGAALRRELVAHLERLAGVTATPGEKLATFRHSVTRYRITLECYAAQYVAGNGAPAQKVRWLRPAEIDDYPLNVTGRKIARMLLKGDGP